MAYTSHGHQISGTIVAFPKPSSVARCGGPGMCETCSMEAAAYYQTPNTKVGTWTHIHADDWVMYVHQVGTSCDERGIEDIACPICHKSLHEHTLRRETINVGEWVGSVATGWDCPEPSQVHWR